MCIVDAPRHTILTIFIPCQSARLSAYTPARALSRSTRRIVLSGIVNRDDLRSCEAKVRYGGRRYSLPACVQSRLRSAYTRALVADHASGGTEGMIGYCHPLGTRSESCHPDVQSLSCSHDITSRRRVVKDREEDGGRLSWATARIHSHMNPPRPARLDSGRH